MKLKFAILSCIFVLLFGCTAHISGDSNKAKHQSSPAPTQSPAETVPANPNEAENIQSPEVSVPTISPEAEPIFSDPLVMPTAEDFGLTGDEAVIYNAAVQYYFPAAGYPHLLLPSIGIYASHTNENGKRSYICVLKGCDYYDLGWSTPENPSYNYGGGFQYVCFTISEDEVGVAYCSDILMSCDGEDWAQSVREVFGPEMQLAEEIISAKEVTEPRYITPRHSEELLALYLETYY